jgi:hypothetical protein
MLETHAVPEQQDTLEAAAMTNGSSHFGSLSEILGVADVLYEDHFVPQWGFMVRIKSMTGQERDRFEASLRRDTPGGGETKNLANVRARMLAIVIVDPLKNNQRMFVKSEDIELLGRKNAAALSFLWDKAAKMNGFTKEDVKDIEANLDDTSGDDSSIT